IHLLRNSTIGLPNDIWVPSTSRVAPSQAFQFSTTIRAKLGKSWASEVAVYFREMTDLVEYLNEPNLTGDWESKVSIGNGSAYGAEFSLRRERGKVRGWIAYTLAKSDRTFDEKINFGKTYPYRFDRLHSISALVSWHPNTRSSLSLSWRFGTGSAYNLNPDDFDFIIDSEIEGEDEFGPFDTDRNALRFPAMHRLDINYRVRLPAPRNAKFTHTFDIGFYNVYDRRNAIYYELVERYERVSSELRANRSFIKIFIAPVLPIFSYQLHFTGRRNDDFDLLIR
ncbi:MAG: hypothetical protein AAFY76_14690, partial [Cyanobacteria bacterium J06649_11]